ncbi:ROK family transcriptional regulator [Saccharopolyspora endophytica]|uniref:ROK family transcriptional regulator n=1 Tax=Saccharopolyspora endophytica TaxID=543886 RepID=A0ABS5DDD2_9PSEU|nr:ROK family transcriptional regulator [Saccharopolyspora endophytica]MBQ0924290.1 ROK family transcriptional regulator [Saccharopolyspora endophytica]
MAERGSGEAVRLGASAGVDQTAVRRANLARVLDEVRRGEVVSRADIATSSKLTKATVSSLAAELIDRGLIRETGLRRDGAVGRPGRSLELDGGGITALGLEINSQYLAARGTDLAGRVIVERRLGFDAMRADPETTLDRLAAIAREAVTELAGTGSSFLAGIAVAVPGLVDAETGRVRYAPNLEWRSIPIAEALRERLGGDVPIVVDNEANLSALAELHSMPQPAADLVYLTGEVGVGAGLITGGRLLRGSGGFSGEIGHVPVDLDGQVCGCGRRGCLETKIGLPAVLRAAAPDLADRDVDPQEQAHALRQRAEDGGPEAMAGFDEIGRWLGIGVSMLVNLLNPGVVVLGGYLGTVAPYLVPAAMRELRDRSVAGDAAVCRITASTYGFSAAVRGASSIVIEEVFRDPLRIPAAEKAVG